MSFHPVNWHEGMFLRPHHFQAAQRNTAHILQLSSKWDVHFNWGLRSLDFDPEALENYQFRVRSLKARLRDGTLICVPQDGDLAPVDLREPLQRSQQVMISLAVPLVQLGRQNSSKEENSPVRYRVRTEAVPDENTGTNPRDVPLQSLNMRLLSQSDIAGYEMLTIACVERGTQAESPPQLHEEFIPPILACDASEMLSEKILRETYERIGKLVKQLARQLTSRGINFDSIEQDARRMFEWLRTLNEAYCSLGVIGMAKGVHPLHCYTELARLVGQLAIFGSTREPPEIPAYDHDDLGHCFYTLKRYIDGYLREVNPARYKEVPFVGEGLRMQAPIEGVWLEPAWQMYIGIRTPNLPRDELLALVNRTDNRGMALKIGASQRVDQIYQEGFPGVRFIAEPTPPAALPRLNDLVYFRINRDASREEWAYVQKTLNLAVRFNEQLVIGEIDGKKTVKLNLRGQQADVTFTLYVLTTIDAGAANLNAAPQPSMPTGIPRPRQEYAPQPAPAPAPFMPPPPEPPPPVQPDALPLNETTGQVPRIPQAPKFPGVDPSKTSGGSPAFRGPKRPPLGPGHTMSPD